jgi:hypothetical protein
MCTHEDPSYVRRDRTRYARSAPDEQLWAEHDAGYVAADAFKATPAYAALNPDLRDAYEGAAETEGRNAVLGLWMSPATPLPRGWVRPGPDDLEDPLEVVRLTEEMYEREHRGEQGPGAGAAAKALARRDLEQAQARRPRVLAQQLTTTARAGRRPHRRGAAGPGRRRGRRFIRLEQASGAARASGRATTPARNGCT